MGGAIDPLYQSAHVGIGRNLESDYVKLSMPKQIDLEPHEYRRKGSVVLGRQWTLWGVLCGIWAGCVIGLHRYWITDDSPWIVALLALGPGAVWGFMLLMADKPSDR